MSTGTTIWAVSRAITVESIVASPLVEVDGAATEVNTGSTTALPIVPHMGYAHFLPPTDRKQICVEKS